jgi:hypothetical protein
MPTSQRRKPAEQAKPPEKPERERFKEFAREHAPDEAKKPESQRASGGDFS